MTDLPRANRQLEVDFQVDKAQRVPVTESDISISRLILLPNHFPHSRRSENQSEWSYSTLELSGDSV
jgi:hypothetical protein